jgi:TPR repeat protein
MMFRINILLLLSLISSTSLADYQTAADALARGDYTTAVREFRAAANQGDALSQAQLGYMHYVGEGVNQDYTEAVRWYRMAANQGNVDAQYNLAVAYAFGEGVAQDYNQAAQWYLRAAQQGHATAQYSLAISYSFGEGVPQNSAEAVRWFARSAEQGYVRAQVQLGSKYHTGDGVGQNFTEAVKWYRRAADRGNASAQYNLGTLYRSGRGVQQDYNQAVRWFRLAADQGYAAAQNELASLQRAQAGASRTGTPVAQAPARVISPTPVPAPIETPTNNETIALNQSQSISTITVDPGQTADESAEITSFISDTLEESNELPAEDVASEPAEEKGGLFGRLFGGRDDTEQQEQHVEPEVATSEPEPEAEPESAIEDDVAVEEESSGGGFFSNIFRRNRDSETDNEVVAEAVTDEELPPVEDLSTDTADDYAETVEEPEVIDTEVAEEKSSGGFFRGLFGRNRDNAEEQVDETLAEAEPVEELPPVEDLSTDSTDDYTDTVEEPEVIDTEVAEEKSSGGFFRGLFGRNRNNTEEQVDETLAEAEPVEELPPVEDLSTDSADDYAETVEEPEVIETEVAEEKSSGGFFRGLFGRNRDNAEEQVDEVTIGDDTMGTVNESSVSMVEETATTIPEQANTDSNAEMEDGEQKSGFFGRLFGSKNDKAEDTTESNTDTAEPEVVTLPYEEDGYDPSNAYSGDPEELQIAKMSLDNKDYALAYEQFRSLAIIGDRNAQYELAALYYQGLGTEQDYFEAARWYKRSAEQGQIDSQYSLGNMFLMGEGINQNDKEAAFWYGKAADQGHESARHNLDNLEKVASAQSDEMVVYEGEEDTRPGAEGEKKSFLSGLFGKKDEEETTEQSAATTTVQQNEEDKGGFFSRIFKRGEDEQESDAAASDEIIEPPIEDVVRQTGMDFIVVEGAENTSTVSGPQPQAPQEPARVEVEEQVEEEKKGGFFSRIFRRGDDEETVAEVSQAEETVNTNSNNNYAAPERPVAQAGVSDYERGIAYSFGEGVDKDPEEAFRLFMLSAQQGYAPAQYKVGAAYAYGDGAAQNAIEAASWYRQAAQQGYALAQRNLGIMYSSGTGIDQDKPLALAWFSILADNGNIMDVRRRDTLAAEMSQAERARADELRQNLIAYINAN